MLDMGIGEKCKLGTTSTDVQIDVIASVGNNLFDMIVRNEACLLISINDVYMDTCFLSDLCDHGFGIRCISHGGGGTGAIVLYPIYLHHLIVCPHEPYHVVCLFLSYVSFGKRVFAQTNGNSHDQHLAERLLHSFAIDTFDQ